MPPHNSRYQILENKKIFDKAVSKAYKSYGKGDLESTVAWSKIAGHFAFVRHPGIYMSPSLENLLVEVAQKIAETPAPDVGDPFIFKGKQDNSGKMRFLHVITESYGTGGHSPYIARWIKNTLSSSVHSLITTAHHGELPDLLSESIKASGGWYCSLSELSSSLMEQALFLRTLSQNWADVIVLIVHPYDPLPTAAFGVKGGPPIIFFNHADHAFWLGSSIADVTVDYHSSAAELSAKRRGTVASRLLPIPLQTSNPTVENSYRKKMGFSDTAVVLLTVGREEKFYPYEDYDFLDVVVSVLRKHQSARLIVVGPALQGRWRKASKIVDGRIEALGTLDRSKLEEYYSTADIYLESFPCGSGTSLLEAGVHGVPLLGLHISDLPHFRGGDDIAFQSTGIQVGSVNEFVESLNSMVSDCHSFRQKAAIVKENIAHEHCSPGWNKYLEAVLQSLPSKHSVRKPQPVNDELDGSDYYWAYLSSKMMHNELPELSFSRLVRAYGNHLSKNDRIAAQTKSLIYAFTKVASFKGSRQFFHSLKESANSAFS